MTRCDLVNHPKACSIAQSRYHRIECAGCEAGKKNDAITAEGLAKEAPPVPRETIQPKKEEGMSSEIMKASILRVLGRKGAMNISALKNFSGQYASKEEFQAVLDGLAASGRIMKKAGIREGSFKVWLPGAVEPQLADVAKKAAPSSDATEPSKKTPRVNRKPPAKPLSTTGKDGAGNKPPGNGGGTGSAYEPIIADLMALRQKIDNAIAALRELG